MAETRPGQINAMNLKAVLFYFLLITLCSCKAQSDKSKILVTSNRVIEVLKEDDSTGFIKLIGDADLGTIGKDGEMVFYDVSLYDSLLKKYYGDKPPMIEVTELYNKLGQMLVKIPLTNNDKSDSVNKEMHLSLLFGPPNFVPLDKISGYDLIRNNEDSSEFHPFSYWQALRGK